MDREERLDQLVLTDRFLAFFIERAPLHAVPFHIPLIFCGFNINTLRWLQELPYSRKGKLRARLLFYEPRSVGPDVFMFTIIGIPAALFGMLIFGIVGAIFPIIAIFSVCVDPEKPFRYPFTIRFFRSDLKQVNATASKQVIAK